MRQKPEQVVMIGQGRKMTYRELWLFSDRLAAWLLKQEGNSGIGMPIAVYGHKHPWMLVCFLGCVKSGRAYCPIDISVPDARVDMILSALPSDTVLATETMQNVCGKNVIGMGALEKIFHDESLLPPDHSYWVSGDETYYIIFTSGSTGIPKGVEISADCLGNYLDWSVGLGTSPEQKKGQIFLNQAPFSFDLSVMDLYTCLASGGTLYCLEKEIQSDYGKLMQALRESGANVWVSTPSFADVCLSEPKFNRELMPNLQVFLFCGETLGNRTARKLMERFPEALVVNTYGPTESTVAVTDVLVTPELAVSSAALPVGRAKPGTRIEIRDTEGRCVPEGEKGEIVIIGNTVSMGYYGQEELTKRAFFLVPSVKNRLSSDQAEDKSTGDKNTGDSGQSCERAYRTGDEGYLQDGMLYYSGRIDLQIKLHGYRIELEDIENNIRRLPEIEHAVVIPNQRAGKVTSLTAYVVLSRQMESDSHGVVDQEAENGRHDFVDKGAESGQHGAVCREVESGQYDVVCREAESGQHGAVCREVESGQHSVVCRKRETYVQETARWKPEDEKAASAKLRTRLAEFLPSYMIPKKFVFLEHMPMTNNGKADRKLLGGRKA